MLYVDLGGFMVITEFLGLFGGLALFLYGMQMMSDGLEDTAGNRMKDILEKLTANRFVAVAVGALITAVIQSSSATTVMVVGFVNSGIMTLRQAVWIIMGANIGTTITGQLIALDVGALAPAFAFIGVVCVTFVKNVKVQNIGKIIAGLGILFIGMEMMSEAMVPLRDSEMFVSLVSTFTNPLVGILAGTGFTALVQSSSAAVGILQALATSGAISFASAVFVLFGTNIGTCITAVLASIGTTRNAKRATCIHLSFNLIGTIIFTGLCMILPIANWVGALSPDNSAAQIANMHTVFNIFTTLLLLPFGNYLATFAEKILPDLDDVREKTPFEALQDEINRGRNSLGYAAIHTDILRQEIGRMMGLARENMVNCYDAIINSDISTREAIKEQEEVIDELNKDITRYISKVLVHDHSGQNVAELEEYLLITNNTERIADHAMNIADCVKTVVGKDVSVSEEGKEELINMKKITVGAMEKLIARDIDPVELLTEISAVEQQIDDLTVQYRENHIRRMREGNCTEEGGVLYSELLIDFERIGDHLLNIAQSYTKMNTN